MAEKERLWCFCDIIQGKTIDVLTVDAYGKNVFTTYCISQDGQLAIMDVASLHRTEYDT